jgi:NhaP-type Na+/H+ and K+/H+ antiporter
LLGDLLWHRPDAEREGAHHFSVGLGSVVGGHTVQRVADVAGDIWISLVVRDSQLVSVRADTRLQAGDLVVILAADARELFTKSGHAKSGPI